MDIGRLSPYWYHVAFHVTIQHDARTRAVGSQSFDGRRHVSIHLTATPKQPAPSISPNNSQPPSAPTRAHNRSRQLPTFQLPSDTPFCFSLRAGSNVDSSPHCPWGPFLTFAFEYPTNGQSSSPRKLFIDRRPSFVVTKGHSLIIADRRQHL